MRKIFSFFSLRRGLCLVCIAALIGLIGLPGLMMGCAVLSRGTETGDKSHPVLDDYRDGLYEGTARGYRGSIKLAVCLESGSIAEIDIIECQDDEFVGGSALDELMEQVLEYNTTDLDAVSGATESSLGFLAAVEDALGKGKK
jgi:uncharacterized protein with FMN-binding domain